MMPFLPVDDALGVNLQMLGNLPKADNEGVGVNAICASQQRFAIA
jgi:SRSO17 transposase